MQDSQGLFSLSIDPVTKGHLADTARWAKFLSIVGMVLLALAIIANIWGISFMDRATAVDGYNDAVLMNSMRLGMVVASIIVIAIAFFPLMYLYQFANRMKVALAANEQEALNDSFLNLKRYFRYIGILVIILLAMYALFFIVFIFGTTIFR
jgi:hypothetical protein